MAAPRRVRFKVCCIQDESELALAVRYGASAIGLVSAMPSGPGPIPDDTIARLARRVPPGVASFLLTCETDPDALIRQRALGANTLQLVDRMTPGSHARIREALPTLRIVQVVHVVGPESVDEAVAAADHVDAILLDSGRPDAAVKVLGGTGRVHDWVTSRAIVQRVCVPVYLAGGLGPGNVGRAVEQVRPFGVDVCSGVRSDGVLDETLLREFVQALP